MQNWKQMLKKGSNRRGQKSVVTNSINVVQNYQHSPDFTDRNKKQQQQQQLQQQDTISQKSQNPFQLMTTETIQTKNDNKEKKQYSALKQTMKDKCKGFRSKSMQQNKLQERKKKQKLINLQQQQQYKSQQHNNGNVGEDEDSQSSPIFTHYNNNNNIYNNNQLFSGINNNTNSINPGEINYQSTQGSIISEGKIQLLMQQMQDHYQKKQLTNEVISSSDIKDAFDFCWLCLQELNRYRMLNNPNTHVTISNGQSTELRIFRRIRKVFTMMISHHLSQVDRSSKQSVKLKERIQKLQSILKDLSMDFYAMKDQFMKSLTFQKSILSKKKKFNKGGAFLPPGGSMPNFSATSYGSNSHNTSQQVPQISQKIALLNQFTQKLAAIQNDDIMKQVKRLVNQNQNLQKKLTDIRQNLQKKASRARQSYQQRRVLFKSSGAVEELRKLHDILVEKHQVLINQDQGHINQFNDQNFTFQPDNELLKKLKQVQSQTAVTCIKRIAHTRSESCKQFGQSYIAPSIKDQAKQQAKEMEKMKRDLNRTKQKLEKTTEKAAQLENENVQYQNQMQEQQNENKALKNQNLILMKKNSQIQLQLDSIKRSHKGQKSSNDKKIQQLNEQLSQALEDIQTKQKIIQMREKQVNDISKQLECLRQANTNLQKKLDQALKQKRAEIEQQDKSLDDQQMSNLNQQNQKQEDKEQQQEQVQEQIQIQDIGEQKSKEFNSNTSGVKPQSVINAGTYIRQDLCVSFISKQTQTRPMTRQKSVAKSKKEQKCQKCIKLAIEVESLKAQKLQMEIQFLKQKSRASISSRNSKRDIQSPDGVKGRVIQMQEVKCQDFEDVQESKKINQDQQKNAERQKIDSRQKIDGRQKIDSKQKISRRQIIKSKQKSASRSKSGSRQKQRKTTPPPPPPPPSKPIKENIPGQKYDTQDQIKEQATQQQIQIKEEKKQHQITHPSQMINNKHPEIKKKLTKQVINPIKGQIIQLSNQQSSMQSQIQDINISSIPKFDIYNINPQVKMVKTPQLRGTHSIGIQVQLLKPQFIIKRNLGTGAITLATVDKGSRNNSGLPDQKRRSATTSPAGIRLGSSGYQTKKLLQSKAQLREIYKDQPVASNRNSQINMQSIYPISCQPIANVNQSNKKKSQSIDWTLNRGFVPGKKISKNSTTRNSLSSTNIQLNVRSNNNPIHKNPSLSKKRVKKGLASGIGPHSYSNKDIQQVMMNNAQNRNNGQQMQARSFMQRAAYMNLSANAFFPPHNSSHVLKQKKMMKSTERQGKKGKRNFQNQAGKSQGIKQFVDEDDQQKEYRSQNQLVSNNTSSVSRKYLPHTYGVDSDGRSTINQTTPFDYQQQKLRLPRVVQTDDGSPKPLVRFKPSRIAGEVIMKENSMNRLVVGKSCFRRSYERYCNDEMEGGDDEDEIDQVNAENDQIKDQEFS